MSTTLNVFLILAALLNVAGGENVTCDNARSCEECVKSPSCYWCTNSEKCYEYKLNHISTYFDHCGWSEARWQYCWLNVMAMVISCSVIAGVLFIALIVCCCWCRSKCRERNQRKMEVEEAELERKEEERRIKSEERKAERKNRTDAVRTKYGLLKEEHGE